MFRNKELIEHRNRLRNFAYRLTNNTPDAEDLVHSTFLRAMEKKHLYKDNSNLYGWLSKILFNLFASSYRRKVKFETQYDPENYIERVKVQDKKNLKLELQDVENAMNDLSKDHKEILIMICVHGNQYAEVSERLKIPIGTVRSRLFRARENLKDMLEGSSLLQNNQKLSYKKYTAA